MKKQVQLKLLAYLNGLLVMLVFVLLAWLSVRFNYEADLTRSGRHTLSQASVEILARVDRPLAITAYAREDSALRSLVKNFVGKFQKLKPDITLQFVNPDAAPDTVRELGINVNGELVLRYAGRSEHVKTNSEQEFVNALQRLLRNEERWLAFIEGHGERNPVGKANHDLGEWVRQLKYRGFNSRAINLAETGVIPDNTSVLVIASPLVPMLPGELSLIDDYIERGGNLLWLVDPGDNSALQGLADRLGVRVENGVVIDTAGQVLGINDPTITLTTARLYPPHPVTSGFDMTVFFPKSAVISAVKDSDWQHQPLLLSGNHTWLETGELRGNVDFDPDREKQGPLSIGISLQRRANDEQQRVLVIGDGDFLSNTYVGNHGNLELGSRIMNWLSSDDEFISLPARTIEDSQLHMPRFAIAGFGALFLLLLPLLFLVTGLVTWARRKKS